MSDNDPLKPSVSDRGFQHMDPIPSEYGGYIYASEASNAVAPRIWVRIHETMPGVPAVDAAVNITLRSAAILRDQLDYLINNHYQVRGD